MSLHATSFRHCPARFMKDVPVAVYAVCPLGPAGAKSLTSPPGCCPQVNGGSVSDKVDWAYKLFEQQLSVDTVVRQNDMIDTIAITRGRGTEGVVTRWGVTRLPRKTHRGLRKVGPCCCLHLIWLAPQLCLEACRALAQRQGDLQQSLCAD